MQNDIVKKLSQLLMGLMVIFVFYVGTRDDNYLELMQDGASSYSSNLTTIELHNRGIYPIFWPSFSPNLNPIEAV